MSSAIARLATAMLLLPVAADPPPPSSDRYDFLGVVERIDPSRQTLVIRRGRKPHYEQVTIRYDANTQFIRAKRPMRPADVRPEMRIWVYLSEDGSGRKTDLARQLTIADPYPDIHGVIQAVDTRGGAIRVSRRYPGGGA